MELADLNPMQLAAVTATEGPVMILAGAGSGKTRTLVARIVYLLQEKHISTHQLLAVTFSNKAAKEMRERVAAILEMDVGALKITTFHAFCANVLRSEANYLGLSRHFTIYDDSESKAVVTAILKRHGISPKSISPFEVLAFIEHLKNQGFYLHMSEAEQLEVGLVVQDDPLFEYYQEYEQELHKANAVDFGGLITGVLQLFATYPQVLAHYQKKYAYLLVDEYQDTNRAQFLLLKKLAHLHGNICVVGDEDQSIYSWRGADIRNVLDFETIFPQALLIKLEQNYRSSKNIIEAASYVIEQNSLRKGKSMWTDNDQGESISIVECDSDQVEANFVASEIKSLQQQGVKNLDMAIFYRGNAQSRLLEDALRQARIAYRVVGGIKFYERKEIKDALAYLRLVVNPRDSLALSRVINLPARGIGVTSLRKIEEMALATNSSLWEMLVAYLDNLEQYPQLRLPAKVVAALKGFIHLLQEAMLLNQQQASLSVIYEKLLHESGLWQSLQASKDYEALARLENLQELTSAIKQFESTQQTATLAGFLETIMLDNNAIAEAAAGEDKLPSQGEVALMTVHGAKGLEFPYVFLVGAEENIFPSYKSLDNGEIGIEEERRLFYVAMTRSMNKLYISYALGRMLFGTIRFNGPGRFIAEIPSRYYRLEHRKAVAHGSTASPVARARSNAWARDRDEYSQEHWGEGNTDGIISSVTSSAVTSVRGITYPLHSWVKHQLYGMGKVVGNEGFGSDEKVEIRFQDGAKKKFMVKHAPIVLL